MDFDKYTVSARTYCIAQGTLCNVMWLPGWMKVWGGMDTCMCMAESFSVHLKLPQHCLLIRYTSIQNKKLKEIKIKGKKKKWLRTSLAGEHIEFWGNNYVIYSHLLSSTISNISISGKVVFIEECPLYRMSKLWTCSLIAKLCSPGLFIGLKSSVLPQ